MNNNEQVIRVLVVDDSAFMRNRLSRMLMKCADLQVVGTATNGRDALEQVRRMQPDVVTLDIEMPGMNGLVALDHIMETKPLPIVMVSALTEEGAAVTLQALDRGAVDFIAKPKDQAVAEIELWERLFQAKVRDSFQARHRSFTLGQIDRQSESSVHQTSSDLSGQTISKPVVDTFRDRPFNHPIGPTHLREFPLVVIGASTGGPNLLKEVLRDLPASFPGALLIIQHMPKYFTKVFAENLNAVAPIPICEAQEGMELRPGEGLVAPGNQHVLVSRAVDGQPRIRFTNELSDQPYRPSIDCAMASAAEQFGHLTIGLVLTGMGNDGTIGSQKIKMQGGTVLVQDEATSLIYGMPRAVIEAGIADKVIPDREVAMTLVETIDSVCGAGT